MKKNDLVSAIAEKTGFTKKDTSVVVDSLIDVIVETLAKGEEINICNFIKLYVTEVPERERVYTVGENIGKKYTIPAHRIPRAMFKKLLKTAVYDI